MRKILTKRKKNFIVLLITVVSMILLLTAVAMLSNYSDEVAVRANAEAQNRTLYTKAAVNNNLANYTAKATALASTVCYCQTIDEVNAFVRGIPLKSEFSDVWTVRYFVGDTLFDEYGNVRDTNDLAKNYRASNPDEAGYIGTFEDSVNVGGKMSVIGFYAPTPDSAAVDAVVVYYARNKLQSFFPEETPAEAEFSLLAIANEKNEIVVGGDKLENSNLKDALRLRLGELDSVNAVLRLVREGKDGTVNAKISGKDYVVSVGADKDVFQDLAVVELYSVDVLCSSSLDFIDTIIMIIILFAVIAVFVVVYLVIRRIQREKEFFNMETTDTKLQCLNRNGFEKTAQKILERNSNSNFAVVVVQLRHFKYIFDTFGEGETSHLLAHIRVACAKSMALEETFGHVEDGQFLMLLHTTGRNELVDRLKTFSYLCAQYKGSHKFDIVLRYGIYEIDSAESVTVSQMIDFANEANNAIKQATAQNANMQFNFYDNELRRIRLLNEDMELRMEGALRDGEFQVFYQPKYNLHLGRQDGCEALVRWYDPKTQQFNPPALFMQLFETNGFIVKLDKYVYAKVCEYISYTLAHGGTVYPVSVNVSRITAVQPDFVDYYYKTKRKYGISDNLLTIEFTESFAYENYETLRKIVDGLHEKGFKCSIDDFGCGYSSYRILKSLPMDEIKLDKFFLEKSDSESRDLAIFQSIIQLAKNLGMKVTQEGVELKEDVELLIQQGCDVVQGYYYSHPLPLSDYITFVANSREHNLTTIKGTLK